MRVLVVGCGMSGLTSLAVLRRAGLDALAVDAQRAVGGQWNNAYDGVQLQNSKDEYCFPGRPYAPRVPHYASKRDVLRYWARFVKEERLAPHIRLRTTVASLRQLDGGRGWRCQLRRAAADDARGAGELYEELFDKVVVATGFAGRAELRKPSPSVPGVATFSGEVTHSVDQEPSWLPRPNSSVAIVGFGASAAGLATYYATEGDNLEVHHCYRSVPWAIPRLLLGVIHADALLFTRLSSIMTPSWYHSSTAERIVQSPLLAWLVYAFWRVLEFIIILSHRAPISMRPTGRLEDSFRTRGTSVTPTAYFSSVRSGLIDNHMGTIEGFGDDGNVTLSNGENFKADYVIYATGFKVDPAPFLQGEDKVKEEAAAMTWQLYRHVVHPDLPNMAFVGLAPGFISCMTEYVQACWVAELFQGELELPRRDVMMRSRHELLAWKRQFCPLEPVPGAGTHGRHYQYMDELLHDLGVDAHRKRSTLVWLLSKTTAADYDGLDGEVRAARFGRRPLAN